MGDHTADHMLLHAALLGDLAYFQEIWTRCHDALTIGQAALLAEDIAWFTILATHVKTLIDEERSTVNVQSMWDIKTKVHDARCKDLVTWGLIREDEMDMEGDEDQ
jgi:hypothetical protein